jgi:hypothetical protein
MEHGNRAPRTSVQNGLAWRASRRTDHVLAGRFSRGEPVQARPGSAQRNTMRPRRRMIDDTKVVDE